MALVGAIVATFSVGEMVGFGSLGAYDGVSESTIDGTVERASLGSAVGEREGFLLGFAVDPFVGAFVAVSSVTN
jgi:hypothetical protein